MLTENVNSNTCNFCQFFKKCSSLSNLSRYQKTAKTKTAATKIDAVPNSTRDMTPMLKDAFSTVLSHSEQQLFTKKKLGWEFPIPLENTVWDLPWCRWAVSVFKTRFLSKTKRVEWDWDSKSMLAVPCSNYPQLQVSRWSRECSADAPCHQWRRSIWRRLLRRALLPFRVTLQCSVAFSDSSHYPSWLRPLQRSCLWHVSERYQDCCIKRFQQLCCGSIMAWGSSKRQRTQLA